MLENYKKMSRKVPNEWKLPDVSIINSREDFSFFNLNVCGLKAEEILDFFSRIDFYCSSVI